MREMTQNVEQSAHSSEANQLPQSVTVDLVDAHPQQPPSAPQTAVGGKPAEVLGQQLVSIQSVRNMIRSKQNIWR